LKQLFILSTFIVILTGCGGGGGSGSSDSGGGSSFIPKTVLMDIGESYNVYPGDRVIKNSETAIVTISHIDGKPESTVTLDEGNASIIYK